MFLLGNEIHTIWLVLGVFSVIMILFGGLVNYMETFLPKIVNDAFRYGKTRRSDKSHAWVQQVEVPKHYFSHFYIFATIYTSILWLLVLGVYVLGIPAPSVFLAFLDWMGTSNRASTTSAEAVFLAMTLLLVQVLKRLYECLFVNVKSKARMNILHYIVGYVHYFCASTGILLEAPGFQQEKRGFQWLHIQMQPWNLRATQWMAAAIFIWAWHNQNVTHRIFAQLRKGSSSATYSIPQGHWFEYVSCPHYTAEVILYACLGVLLGLEHHTGLVVALWVLINQTIAALMSHYWYQDKFDNYPPHRKAIIPFVL